MMLSRFTPLRLLAFLVLNLLSLIVLWLALPFPRNTQGLRDNSYHQRLLRQGKVLTTVYSYSERAYSPRNPWTTKRRDTYAIDWQLLPDYNDESIILQIGTRTEINLTKTAFQKSSFANAEIVEITTKSADLDGANLPWFAWADASLLYWDIQHDFQETDLKLIVPSQGTVELWLGIAGSEDQTTEQTRELFVRLSEIPLGTDRTDLRRIVVSNMVSEVPSDTYFIRRFIIKILAPTVVILNSVFSSAFTVTIAILQIAVCVAISYLFILCIYWWRAGRPSYSEWRDRFGYSLLFTRSHQRAKKKIWGLNGPVPDHDVEQNEDHGDYEHNQPRPLSSPLHFFKSNSPLDDLLVTFKYTAWMVKPIKSRSVAIVNDDSSTYSPSVPPGAKITIVR